MLPSWTHRAACAGLADGELDLWHPDEDWPPEDRRAARQLAREACLACSVKAECTDLGLSLLPHIPATALGMYGGYTGRELQRLARQRGLPHRVVAAHGTRSRRVAGCRCDRCRRAHAAYEHQRRQWAPQEEAA